MSYQLHTGTTTHPAELAPAWETDTEDEYLLTDVEKRISWICSDWSDAINNDSHDEWHSVRMSIYGAVQTLVYCKDRDDDRRALSDLGEIAFENSMDCIQRGKYEGTAA